LLNQQRLKALNDDAMGRTRIDRIIAGSWNSKLNRYVFTGRSD